MTQAGDGTGDFNKYVSFDKSRDWGASMTKFSPASPTSNRNKEVNDSSTSNRKIINKSKTIASIRIPKNANGIELIEEAERQNLSKPKPLVNEGLGLLTLHAQREIVVKEPKQLKINHFKLPVATLSNKSEIDFYCLERSDVAYFEEKKGVNLKSYLYDKRFKKSDDVILCEDGYEDLL